MLLAQNGRKVVVVVVVVVVKLHGEDVLSFAAVSLKLKAQLAHAFSSFARLDTVVLFAFGSCFRAGLLKHLLLAALTLLLKAFVDVNGATLVVVARKSVVCRLVVFTVIDAEAVGLTKIEAAAARQ